MNSKTRKYDAEDIDFCKHMRRALKKCGKSFIKASGQMKVRDIFKDNNFETKMTNLIDQVFQELEEIVDKEMGIFWREK